MTDKYECVECGEVIKSDKPPEKCPKCNAPGYKIQSKK
jgi:rubrerythrin